MTDRIAKLTSLTLQGDMYVAPVKTEFDRDDLLLSRSEMDVKRICEYILNQEPKITPYSAMTGMFNFDGSVVGDAFRRGGHRSFDLARETFYCKPIENLSTFEWQHATADYQTVLHKGISGIKRDIMDSMSKHNGKEEQEFLSGMLKVADALIGWAHKCSARAVAVAEQCENADYVQNLKRLSGTLLRVPEFAPESFYEAVLCIYICFSADPDSVGTLDRYLTPFYYRDIEDGSLTEDEAKEYLQELFLMLQAATHPSSMHFTRGGESHFCVGGYLADHSDGFNALSRLIVEALVELPTYIPQVTLRWTEKTPREVLRFMMDCERKDPHKRIAFTNDEKRIRCYTELCGMSFEQAINYTTVGCNEPAFLGGIAGSTSKGNVMHPINTLFHEKQDQLVSLADFDAFYAVFEEELFSDLKKIYHYDDEYNRMRAGDVNYVSSLFMNGCIGSAKSVTQGGCKTAIASPMLMGLPNLIDSLIVIKQFVYDEKVISMQDLIDALHANWQGYEDLRRVILKKGTFFGNDDERSVSVSQRLYNSFYSFLSGKKNLFGYQWLVGDLTGYNPHFKWFGEGTKASPDGRFNGDALKFGLGQSEGRDREGLTSLLNSVAKADINGIGCGSTVTNITLDAQLVMNDDYFEKLVALFETYFKNGGVHFQLTYVSKEELVCAKGAPEEYKHLRVRVSGFSDYFVKLKDSLQDEIISRTEKGR